MTILPRFKLVCLGCKVNQAEAAFLTSELINQGWHETNEDDLVDVGILLTCTVTVNAARKSRQIAYQLTKKYPNAKILATGCDIQIAPTIYRNNKIELINRTEIINLANQFNCQKKFFIKKTLLTPNNEPFSLGIRWIGKKRTRGLLKIQDGCDTGCAYCIIPTVRGRPRSLPLSNIISIWQKITFISKTSEIVLTGINLGRWGIDFIQPLTLTYLLKILITSYPHGPRIRLSSIEINEVSDSLINIIANKPIFCQHLHIPLQTGSNRLLKSMGRPYNLSLYIYRLHNIFRALPNLCLGTDIIVGLPGEDQIDYEKTRSIVNSLPYAYLHVFSYSPRPGTLAAIMPNHVPNNIIRQRAAELRAISQLKYLTFLRKQIGIPQWAIVENNNLARTNNYCLIQIEKPMIPGTLIYVKPISIEQFPNGPRLKVKLL